MKSVAVLLCLAALATARPQFTPEQLVVIRQHEAIAQANILDNLNPLIWALNAILCLKYGRQRLNQACFAFE